VPPALSVETERLRGEAIGQQHLEQLCALFGDPRVGATLGGVRDREEVTAMIARHTEALKVDGFTPRAWYDRATGAFVARGGLATKVIEGASVVELGWAVVPERWGEGIATELAAASVGEATALGIAGLVAVTMPANVASRRVMEKLGMTYDHTFEYGIWGPHVLYRLPLQRRGSML
jgi:ribosomal-protein-alanine N-acetyltransferase